MGGSDVIDNKLEETGGLGRYQLMHTLLLGVSTRCIYIWHLTVIVFTGYYNDHHCIVPENTTKEEWIPQIVGPDGDLMYDQCHHYRDEWRNVTVTCDSGWTYIPERFHPTEGSIVMEWDLVCSRSNFVEISIVCLNVGLCVGNLVCSPFGDRFGRRLTCFLSYVLLVIFGSATAFSPGIITFCVLSFARGVFAGAVFTLGIVLGVEIVPKRVLATMSPTITGASYALQGFLPVLGYYFTNWRHLQLAISLIPAVFLPYFWWCPESFHWLYENGRMKELNDSIVRAARFNKVQAPSPITRRATEIHKDGSEQLQNGSNSVYTLSNSPASTPETSTAPEEFSSTSRLSGESADGLLGLLHYIKRPRLALYLAVSCYLCFVSYGTYFGLAYLQGSLTGYFYVNVSLNGILAIPGILLAIFLLKRFGRRPLQVSSEVFLAVMMALSAAAQYIAFPGLPRGLLSTIFALIAKLGESVSIAVFNFYCQEFFPTNIRSTVVGVQTACGYLGSILASFTSISLVRIQFWLAGAVYAAINMVAAGLVLFLPETRGRVLPKTADEVLSWPRSLTAAEKLRLKDRQPKKEARQSMYKDGPGEGCGPYGNDNHFSTYL